MPDLLLVIIAWLALGVGMTVVLGVLGLLVWAAWIPDDDEEE